MPWEIISYIQFKLNKKLIRAEPFIWDSICNFIDFNLLYKHMPNITVKDIGECLYFYILCHDIYPKILESGTPLQKKFITRLIQKEIDN